MEQRDSRRAGNGTGDDRGSTPTAELTERQLLEGIYSGVRILLKALDAVERHPFIGQWLRRK